jgi:hypothetical protein
MLYSYQSQEPKPLPNRVRLSDGSTRTSLIELTSSELLSLGFTGPYVQPSYDSKTEKIIWSSEDLQYQIVPLTQQELDALATQELQNKINSVNYTGFWNSLIQSSVYNKLRTAASQDLSANTFCTELIALFSDAKNGKPNVPIIQYYLNILFLTFTFTEEEITEITNLFTTHNLNYIHTLPDEDYITSHTYDPITNTISINS